MDNVTYDIVEFCDKFGNRAIDIISNYYNFSTDDIFQRAIYEHACYLTYVIVMLDNKSKYDIDEEFSPCDLKFISKHGNIKNIETRWQYADSDIVYTVKCQRGRPVFYADNMTPSAINTLNRYCRARYKSFYKETVKTIKDIISSKRYLSDMLKTNKYCFDSSKQMVLPFYIVQNDPIDKQIEFMSIKTYLNFKYNTVLNEHGWSALKMYEANRDRGGSETAYLWEEYIVIDVFLWETMNVMTPLAMDLLALLNRNFNFTNWMKEHMTAVTNSGMVFKIDAYLNAGDWWMETWLIQYEGKNIIIEADFDGEAIEEYFSSSFGKHIPEQAKSEVENKIFVEECEIIFK